MKFELLQQLSSIEEFRSDDIIELPIKGWNHPTDWFEKFVLPELNDYYSESEFRLIKREETGYTCSRYFEEQDARDEGNDYWMDFQKYKNGLGKTTIYTIQILELKSKEVLK